MKNILFTLAVLTVVTALGIYIGMQFSSSCNSTSTDSTPSLQQG